MWTQLRPAIILYASLTLITGAIYPAVVTGIAKLAFSDKANGSLIERDGRAIGSSLIAQPFTDPQYFWPRPSAAGADGYDSASGAGSNLGPYNPALAEAVKGRVDTLRAGGSVNAGKNIPVDLVTTSGSGLDPHISPQAAALQVPRVAKARGLSEDDIRRAITACMENRTCGLLGEPRINVLRLNLALDGD